MELKPIRFGSVSKKRETKTFFTMRALWLLTHIISVTAFSQSRESAISLSLSNAPIEQAFKEIKKQSGYEFVYTREQLKKSVPVTLNFESAPLNEVLNACFKNQPFTYIIEGKFIALKDRDEKANQIPAQKEVSGIITDENEVPLSNINVSVANSGNATATDSKGHFFLRNINENDVLIISAIGYQTKQIVAKGRNYFEIKLVTSINQMDQTLVIAYGTTTRRFNTGSVSKVTSEEISQQPVANPLAALQARVPGLLVTQSSGIPGSSFKVQIRGQNSLLQGTDPLFVIDGVPFLFGNSSINQITTAANLSPLGLINPSDIESIEVLKDADATAIHGSRGANGVILITTKKGAPGKTKINLNVYSGLSKVTRTMDLLNLPEYLEMRREAFQKDGTALSNFGAPDLLLWDTTRYTNWKQYLIGGTAHTNDAELSLSGGVDNTRFLIGGGYHSESTVFPTDLANNRSSFHFSFTHSPASKKFEVNLLTNYSSAKSHLPSADLTSGINASPNIKLLDSAGRLNWEEGGVPFWNIAVDNPLSVLRTNYTATFQNLISNLSFSYKLLEGLLLKTSLGYNLAINDESSLHPSESINPYSGTKPFSYFSTGQNRSWIIEPQLTYNHNFGSNTFTILLGGTWQNSVYSATNINALDFSSDNLLGSINGAGKVTATNIYSQYRYAAAFARIHYQWLNKYILNFSARRDGSSRFGPDNRFSNFGSAGIAWLFSNEAFLKRLHFLSYGKLRASIGTTGNDQIGNYRFLDTWGSSSQTYQNIPGLTPNALFNPNLSWERVEKKEAALELGFFNDRLLTTAAYFNNRSGNQLASYALPIQTGFSSVAKNFDALIQNTGLEFTLSSTNIQRSSFSWTTSFNLTAIKNKLLSFQNLATSSYFNVFVIGQPLSSRKLYQYLGVDPATGIYQFSDANRDGILNNADQVIYKNTDPKFYGGFINDISVKNLRLSLTVEFKKQQGLNYLNTLSLYPPGYGPNKNQPVIVLNRWQKTGDVTNIGKFTGTYGTPAYNATINYLTQSNVIYSDASFLRFKNIALSYNLPHSWLTRLKAKNGQLYIHAQNLITLTRYVGSDPENQNLYVLPPLKTITTGVSITF